MKINKSDVKVKKIDEFLNKNIHQNCDFKFGLI